MYDDLHSKRNPLISNTDLSFTQRATKKIAWDQHNLWNERKMEIFSTEIANYWWDDSLSFQNMEFKCLHHSTKKLYSKDFPYLRCKKKVSFVSYKLLLLKSTYNINLNGDKEELNIGFWITLQSFIKTPAKIKVFLIWTQATLQTKTNNNS